MNEQEKDASDIFPQTCHDDKGHVPVGEPHGNDNRQRWFVDYNHNVRSGSLIDFNGTKGVIRCGNKFYIVDAKDLFRSHYEALAVAIERVGKVQMNAANQLSMLLCEMQKAVKK